MPVAYMDVDAMTQSEDTKLPEEESEKTQVWLFTIYVSMILVLNCLNSMILLFRTWPMARFKFPMKEKG